MVNVQVCIKTKNQPHALLTRYNMLNDYTRHENFCINDIQVSVISIFPIIYKLILSLVYIFFYIYPPKNIIRQEYFN